MDRGEEAPILAGVLSWSILPLSSTRWKLWSYAKSKQMDWWPTLKEHLIPQPDD